MLVYICSKLDQNPSLNMKDMERKGYWDERSEQTANGQTVKLNFIATICSVSYTGVWQNIVGAYKEMIEEMDL